MDAWERCDAVDWLVVDHRPEGVEQAELGLVLGHGYGQETPSELGIGWAAATALAKELRRPRETADHRVVELDVAVQVNLQDTVLLFAGESEAVRLGLAALDQVLWDPSPLEPADPAVPAQFGWDGWTNELSAWFGMGSAALATSYEVPWAGDAAALQRLVAGLHPARGTRAVAWTTDTALVGTAFRQPLDSRPDDRPSLTWREPAPTATGAGSLAATYDNNLLSSRLPASTAGRLAVGLLAQPVHRNLVEFGGLAAGLQLNVEQVGADLLIGMRATATDRGFDASAVGTALDQALEAYAGFPDAVLAAELDRSRQPEALERELNPFARAVRARRSGLRPTSAELVAELEAVTVDDLRQASGALLAGTLRGVARTGEPDAARPLFTPAPPPPIARPTVTRRSRIVLPLGPQPAKQVVRATTSTLQVTSRTPVRRGQAKPAPTVTAIDLRSVAVRADSDDVWTTLIDRDNRRVTLAWPAYRSPGPLRALVDAATPAAVRISPPAAPGSTAAVRTLMRKYWVGTVILAVVSLGFLALFVWHPVTGQSYQDPVVATVAADQLVTLGNGSTVKVSTGRWDASLRQGREVVSADVSYCGGGPTSDRNTADDARNYVTPDRFEVTGITPASRRVLALRPGEVSLEETQLADGQCTSGRVAFEVDSAEPVPGVQLRYHNGSGDQITWTLD